MPMAPAVGAKRSTRLDPAVRAKARSTPSIEHGAPPPWWGERAQELRPRTIRHRNPSHENGQVIGVNNEIIVNASATETRVAILEKGQFVELYVERESVKSVVGSVIKGRVSRVLPGMQAAFVDIGLDKAGFLYVGDYFAEPDEPGAPESKSGKGDNGKGNGRGRRGRGRSGHRAPPPIESVLSEGQEIVVQVAKEPIGTKGARITSHVSIAGRHLVLTPWSPRVGVSRRIDSDRERKRLRQIVSDLRPKDLGFIIRTAGDGLTEADLEADIRYLTSVWDEIQFKKDEVAAPEVLYTEPNLPLRVVRDFASGDTKRIVIDDEATYGRMKEFIDRYMAAPGPRLDHYRGKQPIFDDFGLETQLHRNLERKVPLKSGGSLVIDQSEALTAIDVNSGRYVGKSDLEETVFKTNLEAVKEVVAQLRFRNIGGIIIIDLIDMESAGKPRQGLPGAAGGAARGQGAHEPAEDLRARAGRDDAQADAREPRPDALRALRLLRGPRLRALAGERGAADPARGAQGGAALLRSPPGHRREPGGRAPAAGRPPGRARPARRGARLRARGPRAARPPPGTVRGDGARLRPARRSLPPLAPGGEA